MQKSIARNPNMLRTLIGLGLTLIIVLGYAVYSASLDSEYYLYTTSNEEVDVQLEQQDQLELQVPKVLQVWMELPL